MTKKIANSPWLLSISAILLIVYFGVAYFASRPARFIKTAATIQSIEIDRYESKGGKHFLNVAYKYVAKDQPYLGSDKHFLPQKYYSLRADDKELQQYVNNWRTTHPIGSEMVVLIHSWSPSLSGFEKTNVDWFSTFVLTALFFWLPSTLLVILIFLLFRKRKAGVLSLS
jgi:hypothetical protein